MYALIKQVEQKFTKKQVVDVRSGDNVKVHQRIKEGAKERIQIFEGLVIRTDRKDSMTSTITVRRIASGVGVEKSFLLHSPLVEKVEDFDKKAVNDVTDPEAEAEVARLHEEQKQEHEAAAAEKAAEDAKLEAKADAVQARHDETKN